MTSKPSSVFDAQKALFDLALQVRKLKPWEHIVEDDLWVIRFAPPRETLYCMVIGAMGQSLGVVFYRGDAGLRAWRKITSQEMDSREAVQHLDCLVLDFDPWNRLSPDHKKKLKRLGYVGGPEIWPSFSSYRPGKPAVFPDTDEVEMLTKALRISLRVIKVALKNEEYLVEGPDDCELHFDGEHPNRKGEWLPLPEETEPPLPAPPELDELAVKRLDREALRSCAPWEIHAGHAGIRIKNKNQDYFPLAILLADSTTGFVAGITITTSAELPEILPQHVLKSMRNHNARPEAFHVEDEGVAAALKPLAEALEIPIVRKERLRQAREALLAMREHLGQRNS